MACQPISVKKKMWADIKDLATESILFAIKSGELSIQQNRGVITLLHEKTKDRHFLKKLVINFTIKATFSVHNLIKKKKNDYLI